MDILALGLAWAVIGFQFAGLVCLGIFARQGRGLRRKAAAAGCSKPWPGVTILRPCHLADDNEAENFEGFYIQDYPGPIEILYVVRDSSVPCAPIIREILQRHSGAAHKMIETTSRQAIWRKVDSLRDGARAATHDIVIWTDSDLVVGPSYVREVVTALEEPGVSVVTVPQCDFRVDGFWTACRTLGNNADVGALVSIPAALASHQKAAWGQTIAYRRSEFDELGGETLWQEMSGMLADDQALAHFFARAGKRIVWRAIWGPVEFSRKTFRQVLAQKQRWTHVQVAALGSRLGFAAGLLVLNPILMALVAWGIGGGAGPLLAALALRLALGAVFEVLILRQFRMWPRWAWAIPLYDLGQVYFAVYGLLKQTIEFNGQAYRVVRRFYLEAAGQREA